MIRCWFLCDNTFLFFFMSFSGSWFLCDNHGIIGTGSCVATPISSLEIFYYVASVEMVDL
jgi:hypothetical protein